MLSSVYGIIDKAGGVRVVVTEGSIEAHLLSGEKAYKLPNTLVEEPVAFEAIPNLIQKVLEYVASCNEN